MCMKSLWNKEETAANEQWCKAHDARHMMRGKMFPVSPGIHQISFARPLRHTTSMSPGVPDLHNHSSSRVIDQLLACRWTDMHSAAGEKKTFYPFDSPDRWKVTGGRHRKVNWRILSLNHHSWKEKDFLCATHCTIQWTSKNGVLTHHGENDNEMKTRKWDSTFGEMPAFLMNMKGLSLARELLNDDEWHEHTFLIAQRVAFIAKKTRRLVSHPQCTDVARCGYSSHSQGHSRCEMCVRIRGGDKKCAFLARRECDGIS